MKYSEILVEFESRFNPIIFLGTENNSSIILCPVKAKFSKRKLALIVSDLPDRYARNGLLCEISEDKSSGDTVLIFQKSGKPETNAEKIDQINKGQRFADKCSHYKTIRTNYSADNIAPNKQIPRDVCLVRFGIG